MHHHNSSECHVTAKKMKVDLAFAKRRGGIEREHLTKWSPRGERHI